MRARSSAPTRPVVRSDSSRWMVTTSERANSSSLETSSAPTSAQRSAVRLWLQATTFMPKALAPILATAEPSRPRPTQPRVLPARSKAMRVCQPPWRITMWSCGTCRAVARISAQVCSVVLVPEVSVPQHTTPRLRAAAKSTDLFRMPLVMNSFRFGRRSNTAAGNGVRSRMAHTTSKSLSRSTRASCSTRLSSNETGWNPARLPQSAMSSADFA